MIIDASGNVGIGTTAPAQALEVSGRIKATGISGNSFPLELNTDTTSCRIIMKDTNSTSAVIVGSESNDLVMRTNSNERVRVDSSGNVGIGTTTPAYKLDVAGDIHISNSTPYLIFTDTDTNAESRISANSSLGSLTIDADYNNEQAGTNIIFKSDGAEKMRIDDSGNVGIGTTTPASGAPYENYKLTLDGGGWYGYEIMNMVNGASRTGVNTNDPGILLNSVGMNATSWATPGLFFTSTDSNFTTERPKYLAAIVGQATSTYNDDGDAGMNINFRLTGNNQGTSNLLYATSYGYNMTATSFYHFTDNTGSMGLSSRRWSVVYAASASINTSDVRDKTDIDDLDYGLNFVNSLRPVKYRYADRDSEIQGVRTHMGFIAQEVETVLGDDAPNRGLWTSSQFEKTAFLDEDENPVYVDVDRQGLRYEEMIAPMVKAIQELTARIEALEGN
jgi:hypothetical protein